MESVLFLLLTLLNLQIQDVPNGTGITKYASNAPKVTFSKDY